MSEELSAIKPAVNEILGPARKITIDRQVDDALIYS